MSGSGRDGEHRMLIASLFDQVRVVGCFCGLFARLGTAKRILTDALNSGAFLKVRNNQLESEIWEREFLIVDPF
jgi:hypothetical protein